MSEREHLEVAVEGPPDGWFRLSGRDVFGCTGCLSTLVRGRKVYAYRPHPDDLSRSLFCPGCVVRMDWLSDDVRDEALRLAAAHERYRRYRYPDGRWAPSLYDTRCKDCHSVIQTGDRVFVLKWLDPTLSGALCETCGRIEEAK